MKFSFFRRAVVAEPAPAPAPRPPPPPADIALAYHDRTKHHPHRFAASLGYLDWDTQPDPFRRFAGAERWPLPFADGVDDEGPSFDLLQRPRDVPVQPVCVETLARFLELGLALSASKSIESARWFLRVNPSSGNLHPTEGYVVAGAMSDRSGVPAPWGDGAVLHYAPEDHALELRARMPREHWAALAADLPADAFLVALTDIPWRESWKYGERAYRYCQHDAGHALAALAYSAAARGWSLSLLDGCADDAVARLLGLDRDGDFADAEREHPVALAVVTQRREANGDAPGRVRLDEGLLAAHAALDWRGTANRLSADHVSWEVIDVVADATAKPTTAPLEPTPTPMPPDPPAVAVALAIPERPSSARRIILARRSAVDLDGKTGLPLEDALRVLERTLPVSTATGQRRTPFDALPWAGRVHLAIFVHRVDGLVPGVYALVRRPDALEMLRACLDPGFAWRRPDVVPDGFPLYLLRAGDFRGTAASVSCTQSIAADGVLSLGMLAELDERVREGGAWWYRWLHWEAGAIGQVLYLEAEAAGIRGTGIGCFFDDAVHGVLGLSERRVQTIYHFTMGGPVDDPRLATASPYADDRRREGWLE